MEPFITAEELAGYVRRDLSTTPLVGLYLDAACQTIRSYLHQEINYTRNDEVFVDGTDTDALLLPELPVISVASVFEFSYPDGAVYVILEEDVDYRLGAGGILWRLGHRWAPGHANILVTYTHGWRVNPQGGSGSGSGSGPPDPVPADIKLVALSAAKRALEAGITAGAGIQSESIGKYSYTLNTVAAVAAGDLSSGEKKVLDNYRERRVA